MVLCVLRRMFALHYLAPDQYMYFSVVPSYLAKGLEFDCVIIDMTTQLSAKDFYVAMTRAKKKLTISYGKEKNGKSMEPSRFVEEVMY